MKRRRGGEGSQFAVEGPKGLDIVNLTCSSSSFGGDDATSMSREDKDAV